MRVLTLRFWAMVPMTFTSCTSLFHPQDSPLSSIWQVVYYTVLHPGTHRNLMQKCRLVLVGPLHPTCFITPEYRVSRTPIRISEALTELL